jgi:hypothetical protein
VWCAAIGAVVARCAVTWFVTVAVGSQVGIAPQVAGWASVISGAPGIILQLVVAPPLVYGIRRRHSSHSESAA